MQIFKLLIEATRITDIECANRSFKASIATLKANFRSIGSRLIILKKQLTVIVKRRREG